MNVAQNFGLRAGTEPRPSIRSISASAEWTYVGCIRELSSGSGQTAESKSGLALVLRFCADKKNGFDLRLKSDTDTINAAETSFQPHHGVRAPLMIGLIDWLKQHG